MNVLSLFDGMSCGQIALNRCGIKYENYYASEIDKHAIKVTQANYPNTIQIGDVRHVTASQLLPIHLIIAGSPCQGFSFAGKMLNFNDERSKLFFEFVRILNEIRSINPYVKFMLENVKMKKEHEQAITNILGVRPIRLNSSLVSAQNRNRLYWTNIKVSGIPDSVQSVLFDILQDEYSDDLVLTNEQIKRGHLQASAKTWHTGNRMGKMDFPNDQNKKAKTLATIQTNGGRETNHIFINNGGIRRLTPIEYERLQTVPDNYTNHVSSTQRYKMLGNGWAVDIICHLFSFIPIHEKTAQVH